METSCPHNKLRRHCTECWWNEVSEVCMNRSVAIKALFMEMVDPTPVCGILPMASELIRRKVDLATLPINSEFIYKEVVMPLHIYGHMGNEEVIYLKDDKCVTRIDGTLKVYHLDNADAHRYTKFFPEDWTYLMSARIPDDLWVSAPDIFLPKLVELAWMSAK